MKEYIIKSTHIAEQGQACENCGKLISYFALIQEQENCLPVRNLKVGIDCAETLKSRYPYFGRGVQMFKASRVQRKLKLQKV